MPDDTDPGRGCVDRLPIMVSGKDVTKLLAIRAIPKLQSGTAAVISDACLAEIRSWGLEDRIVAMCFDTTASNTGCKGGVCIKLETELGKELLILACRHHVSEIVLEKVFSLPDSARSPKLELFSRFRDFWPHIDQAKYRTAMEDKDAAQRVTEIRDNVITFALQQLSTEYHRDDYKELLELTVIFPRRNSTKGNNVQVPRGISPRALDGTCDLCDQDVAFQRSISHSITPEHREGISTILLSKGVESFTSSVTFVTTTYVKYWFTCTSPNEAPKNDLEFLKAIHTYQDKEVSQVALTAFSRHLWYLSETLVGLSLLTIQSPSTKSSAWSTARATIRDLMNLQRGFLRYIIHLQKHYPTSSPRKYSRSSDWMTLFLIETRNSGSQNDHTVRQKTSYPP